MELKQAEGRPSGTDVKTARAALGLRAIYQLKPRAFSVKDALSLCVLREILGSLEMWLGNGNVPQNLILRHL